MTTILDIGAGSKEFLEALKSNNPNKNFIGFCGEPSWEKRLGEFHKFRKEIISQLEAEFLIIKKRSGIHLINSKYDNFRFKPNSLDMVTLNCPGPSVSISGIEMELDRCLKNGGIFLYSHVIDSISDNLLPENFTILAHGFFPKVTSLDYKINLRDFSSSYPINLPNLIFPSRVLFLNIVENFVRENYENCDELEEGFAYKGVQLRPNFKVWMKN